MLNTVSLAGRVGGDPDVKYFQSGNVVCKLTLAVRRRKRDSAPDWFTLELWGKTAEVAANYVRKGSLIGVSGPLGFQNWTDRNTGAPRSMPVLKVSNLDLLGSRADNQQSHEDEF